MYISTDRPDETKNIIEGRHRFIEKYCKKKGWAMGELTIQQILEIRRKDGWKNPMEEQND